MNNLIKWIFSTIQKYFKKICSHQKNYELKNWEDFKNGIGDLDITDNLDLVLKHSRSEILYLFYMHMGKSNNRIKSHLAYEYCSYYKNLIQLDPKNYYNSIVEGDIIEIPANLGAQTNAEHQYILVDKLIEQQIYGREILQREIGPKPTDGFRYVHTYTYIDFNNLSFVCSKILNTKESIIIHKLNRDLMLNYVFIESKISQ